MIYIRSWKDLKQYGIDLLTGEGCALAIRGSFDLTEKGLNIIKRTVGAVELVAPANLNSGAIASLLMPYAMFEPVAVFAQFIEGNCHQVVTGKMASGDSIVIGARRGELEAEMARLGFEDPYEYLEFSGVKVHRLLTYPEQRPGAVSGMSNVHQMTGHVG